MSMGEDFEGMRGPYGMAVHDIEEENAVLDVIRNHKTIMGEKVKQFEKDIATLFGKELGIMVKKNAYTNKELKEFRGLIFEKIERAEEDLARVKSAYATDADN